jgi:hypothetical protein
MVSPEAVASRDRLEPVVVGVHEVGPIDFARCRHRRVSVLGGQEIPQRDRLIFALKGGTL